MGVVWVWVMGMSQYGVRVGGGAGVWLVGVWVVGTSGFGWGWVSCSLMSLC